jgi:hypothetical protein
MSPQRPLLPVSALLLICGSLVATGFLIWREASAGSSAGWQREETQLDRNAREIREALAKPIPPPEPLPAITAQAGAHDGGQQCAKEAETNLAGSSERHGDGT